MSTSSSRRFTPRRALAVLVVAIGVLFSTSTGSRAQETPRVPCEGPVVDFWGCPFEPLFRRTDPQLYRLGTFNMAGGNTAHGDSKVTADALSKSVLGRGADIVFLQEACQRMTDWLKPKLVPEGYAVKFVPTERRCIKRERRDFRRDAQKRDGSAYGIGIIYRQNRFGGALPEMLRSYRLPSEPFELRMMVCLEGRVPRRNFACSTHLTAAGTHNNERDKNRRQQVEEITRILETKAAEGFTVLLGGDLNTTPEKSSLNALWDPRYGDSANGPFIEVSSGPSTEINGFQRNDGEKTFSRKKIDYIFVMGVAVVNAEVGRSTFSDHHPLWATVLQPGCASRDEPRCAL